MSDIGVKYNRDFSNHVEYISNISDTGAVPVPNGSSDDIGIDSFRQRAGAFPISEALSCIVGQDFRYCTVTGFKHSRYRNYDLH